MARLYPKGAPRDVIDHPAWGHFKADPDHGYFDLPDEMSDEMHSFHHRGKPAWETEDERSLRQHGDELARRRDPAALYDAVGDFTSVLGGLAARLAPADRDAEVAELRRRLAELEGAASPSGSGDDAKDGEKTSPKAAGKAAA